MENNAKIFVAGHRGLVGSAIVRRLRADGIANLLLKERSELDLTCQAAVQDFFLSERPDSVFLAAARVGGINANNSYPAEFIHENLAIQGNVIHWAFQAGVKRLMFLGSSCIYPRLAPQPMNEDALLTGLLEPTNEPYAIAKIAGIKMCEAYSRQYGARFFSVMPTNLYGPGDNFDLANSHVLPALIRKCHEAKTAGDPEVVIWGTGLPKREFLHVDDMAAACAFVMNLPEQMIDRQFRAYPDPSFINIGTGQDVTIGALAEMVRDVVGFRGELRFDTSKPDGPPRKLLDVSRLTKLGWTAQIELRAGIASTYAWFLQNRDQFRG